MSRYRDAAFPVEGSGRPLRSRSISGLSLRSLALRPATFLSTLRSGCYQTPRKTRYAAARLRLCRHPRRLNSTRLQGATPTEPCVNLSIYTAPDVQPLDPNGFTPRPGLLPSLVGPSREAEQCSPFGPAPLQSPHPYYGLLRPCAPRRYSRPCGGL